MSRAAVRCTIVLVVMGLFALRNEAMAQNLALNPSFELGTATTADSWAPCQTSGSAAFSMTTFPVRTGTRAVRLDVAQSGDTGLCSGLMPVNANRGYVFSAWLQAPAGRQAGLRVIEWRSDLSVVVGKTVAISSGASSGWSEVKGSFVTGSATSFVQLRLTHSVPGTTGTGTFFWDDVSLSLGDPTIPNSSFETGTSTTADGWVHCQTSGASSFSISTSPVHTGLRSIRMDVTQSGDTSVCSALIGVVPNTPYVLSAWLKASLGQRAALRIIEWDSASVPIADKTVVANSGEISDWDLLEGAFVTDSNTRFVQIRLMHSIPGVEGTGTFYWDDVALSSLNGTLEEASAHLCPAPQNPPACNESNTVNQWQCWQKTLRSVGPGEGYKNTNTYRDLELTVEFLDSSGTVVRTGWGFWDCRDGNQEVFRIRTALPPGTYTWRAKCKRRPGGSGTDCAKDPNLNAPDYLAGGLANGTFVVSPMSANNDRYDRGLLTMSVNRRFLRQGNTTIPFFWLADTAWDAVKQANRAGDWATYLDTRKKQGFTAVLLATAPHTANISQSEVFETLKRCSRDSSVLPNNCSRWLPAYWQQYEAKIQDANAKGMVAMVAGLMEPFAVSSDPQLGRPQWLSIFARNLAARLAGHHVIFSPGFDIVAEHQTMANAVGNAIDKAVPAHLITHHAAGKATCNDYTAPFQTVAWHDFHVFQSGHCGQLVTPPDGQPMVCDPRRDLPGTSADETANACVTRRAREMSLTIFNNTEKVKPVVNGEAVYDGNPANSGAASAPDNRAFVRQTAYLSALSGAFGFTYGTDYFSQWNVTPSTLSAYLGPVPTTGGTVPPAANHSAWDMQRMASIFKQRPFKDLLPDPGKILNQQAAEEKKMVYAHTSNNGYHLVYLPNHPAISSDPGNTKVRLNLSALEPAFTCNAADWTIRWLNPRDGTVPSSAACQSVSPGVYDFVKPSNCITCEWVLAIDRTSTAPPPGAFDVWPDFDGEGTSIWGQIYDSTGAPVQEPAQLNQTSSESFFRKQPTVAHDSAGKFLVAWESEYQDGSQWGIFGRWFDDQGTPLGDEFQINTQTDSDQVEPSVAASPAGEMVAVWTSFDQDGDRGGIFAQQYGESGQPKGSEFQINTTSEGHQGSPLVGLSSQGDFVVVWESDEQDGEGARIFARKFDSWGVPIGPEFRVDANEVGDQVLTGLEVRPDGTFTVTWHSYGSVENSPSSYSREFGSQPED